MSVPSPEGIAPSALAGKIARLRPRDVVTVARALWWSTFARATLSLSGWARAQRMFGFVKVESVERELGALPALDPSTMRALRVVQRTLDLKFLHVLCLPRSIAIERTLASRGVPAELVIGVLLQQGFKAHAWIEIEGFPVAEAGRNQWAALARFRRA